jgi:hypothetical protein|tara:strand:+ start:387 stop:518 length:132 start_codon:yes stop_codon:yes gene_type:complete
MNKKLMIEKIIKYYISIDRDKIPDIHNYSKKELQKVCELFMLF